MVQSITASFPGPEAAKQPQTTTLPPPCLTVDVTGHALAKKSNFKNIYSKIGLVLVFMKMFLGKSETVYALFFFFLGPQWFSPWNTLETPLLPRRFLMVES